MDSPGRYFDGQRPVPRSVTVRRLAAGLDIRPEDDGPAIIWPLGEIRLERHGAEAHLHRVTADRDTGERLTLPLAAFELMMGSALAALPSGRAGEASNRRILVWSVAAIASVVFLLLVGLPLFARLAVPLVPWRWEEAIGRSVEPQVVEFLAERSGRSIRFCGRDNPAGRAALDAMVSRLTAGTTLRGPLVVDVVDIPLVNAFAMPGGRIYLFRPILDMAEGPDEVAGVLAHEIGHVRNRDSLRAIIHGGALSLVIGLVIGDVTGGSTLAIMGKVLAGQAYSRENESEADRVSVELMRKAGADPRAINLFFRRISPFGQASRSVTDLLAAHPVTEDRIAEVERLAAGSAGQPRGPILDTGEWQALKSICGAARKP
ncbi:M48 family metallopeptidase [Rhabdaerophilum sp. SD176]|uniref:M48 family metallopeptidase n=1 Tax=Rhabdaerophilum sp. SD176 TaxID=2983548 RepID=UPI0024DF8CF4|nr:M48 family metallopeptidase [Rhabdaerophilum sp. SD176]